MLYHLFQFLDQQFDFIGAGAFQFISFRAAMAVIFSLLLSLIFGGKAIGYLQSLQIGETVRDLGLKGQTEKAGTPTMGGIIILLAIIIPTILFARLDNIYILLILLAAIWMGIVGYVDDYIKVFKQNKEGMAGKIKVISQIGLGLIVGTTLYFHDDVVVRENIEIKPGTSISISEQEEEEYYMEKIYEENIYMKDVKAPITTIPFFKNNEFNYAELLSFLGEGYEKWAWLIYIPLVIFIVTAVSNGANITDGLDGLCIGITAIIVGTLGIFAYVSGNIVFADYLNIMYIPLSGELVVFSAALIGACVGFLWFNSYPAQVFLGDTGSLALGGIVAALAIMVRKELLIPILCGIYLIENVSVILQVGYFKYTRRTSGTGKRLFLMAPLHHHFQKKGMPEAKIVIRFWIIGIFLAVLTMITLKLR